MRTAVISDLHLGLASGGDVLRNPRIQEILVGEIADADCILLLGDVVELREQSIGRSLDSARPFFEMLGGAAAAREVVLVPGNHDHRFAEPMLDRLDIEGVPLGLEHLADPSAGPAEELAELLRPARLRIAYPGFWLREDVYATHGHYIDPHLKLPRAECVAAAAVARIRGHLPASPAPADYERILRPIYGIAYAVAQSRRRPVGHQQKAAEAAWEMLSGERRNGLTPRVARAGFPLLVHALNSVLHADFDPEVSSEAIFRRGFDAGIDLARSLGLDQVHVITGHTHRSGPLADESDWSLPGGGRLHNTGSWVFATAFHHPGRPPSPYWPGTVTWVEDDKPPRRVHLLQDHSHADLLELVQRSA